MDRRVDEALDDSPACTWTIHASPVGNERAIAESKKALELAPDENKDAFRGYLERMRAMVAER